MDRAKREDAQEKREKEVDLFGVDVSEDRSEQTEI